MKVLIIALPGTGKTTMVSSIYGYFKSQRKGLSLYSYEDDHELISRFNGIKKGVFPDKTESRSEYKMVLKYDGKEICDMSFVDYQGGIFAPGYKVSRSDINMLKSDISDCEAIFCMVESKQFKPYNPFLLHPLQMLTAALSKIDHMIPVGFVLTKSDLLDKKLTHSDYYKVLGSTLEKANDNSNFVFGVFSISCVDEFYTLEAPLSFLFIHSVVRNRIIKRNELNKKAEELNNRGLWADLSDWIYSRWNSLNTDKEIHNSKVDDFNNHTDIVITAINKMGDMLGDALIVPEEIDFNKLDY